MVAAQLDGRPAPHVNHAPFRDLDDDLVKVIGAVRARIGEDAHAVAVRERQSGAFRQLDVCGDVRGISRWPCQSLGVVTLPTMSMPSAASANVNVLISSSPQDARC